MRLNVVCTECDQAHRVRDEYGGRRMKCRGCGMVLEIPAPLVDEFQDDDFEDVDDFSPSLPKPRSKFRKAKKRKKKRQPQRQTAAEPMFVNRLQLTVLVLIVVLATRYLGFFRGAFLFSKMHALFALFSAVAYVAIIIGGIGIFQKKTYGASLVEKGAWGMIAITILGLIAVGLEHGTRLNLLFLLVRSMIFSTAMALVLPGALIYCVRQPDWDKPEEI